MPSPKKSRLVGAQTEFQQTVLELSDPADLWQRLLRVLSNCPPGIAAISHANDKRKDPQAFSKSFDETYNKLEALSAFSPLTSKAWIMLVTHLKVPGKLAKLCTPSTPCRSAAALRALNLLLQSAVKGGCLPSDSQHWRDRDGLDNDMLAQSMLLSKQLAAAGFMEVLQVSLSIMREELQAQGAAHASHLARQDTAGAHLTQPTTSLRRSTAVGHQPLQRGSFWTSLLDSPVLESAGIVLGIFNNLQLTFAPPILLTGLSGCMLPAGGLAVAALQWVSTCLDLPQCHAAGAAVAPGGSMAGEKSRDCGPIIQDSFLAICSVAALAAKRLSHGQEGPVPEFRADVAGSDGLLWDDPTFLHCLHTLPLAAHIADVQQASCGSSSGVSGSSGAASASSSPAKGSSGYRAAPSLISSLQCFQRSLQLLGYSRKLFSAIPAGMELPQTCSMEACMAWHERFTEFAQSAQWSLQLPAGGRHAELHLLLPPIVLAWAAGQPGNAQEQPRTSWGTVASGWGVTALKHWESLQFSSDMRAAHRAAEVPPAIPAAIAADLVRETLPRVLDVLAAAVAAPQPKTQLPASSGSNLQVGCAHCGAQAIELLALLIKHTPVSAQPAPNSAANTAAAASSRGAAACSAAAWRNHAAQLSRLLEAVLRLPGSCEHCSQARRAPACLDGDGVKYQPLFHDVALEPKPDSLFQRMLASAPLDAHSRQSKCMQLLLDAAVALHQPKAQLQHCSLLSTLIKHSTSLVCAAGSGTSGIGGSSINSSAGGSPCNSQGPAAEQTEFERLSHLLSDLTASYNNDFTMRCLLGTTRGVCAALHAAWLAAPPGSNSSCSADSRDGSISSSGDGSVGGSSRDGSVSGSVDSYGCTRSSVGTFSVPGDQAADAGKHTLLEWQSLLASRCCVAWATCLGAVISAAQASKPESQTEAAAAATGGARHALKARRKGPNPASTACEGSPAASPGSGSWCHQMASPTVWVELYALLYSCSSWLDQVADQQHTGFDAACLKHKALDAMRLCSEAVTHIKDSGSSREEASMPLAHAHRAAVSVGEFGRALSMLPSPKWCNDPCCSTMSAASELQLVAKGRSKICGGCRVARYCGRECQVRHWPLHKPVCKQLQLAASQKPAAEV